MANRTIEQKILKMKRRGKKPVYGKQFINTGQGPKVGAMTELYRHKLVDTAFDRYLNARFPGKLISVYELQKKNEIVRVQINLEKIGPKNEWNLEKIKELEGRINPLADTQTKLTALKERVEIPLLKLFQQLQDQMKVTMLDGHFKIKNAKGLHTQDLFYSSDKNLWCLIDIRLEGKTVYVRKSQTFPSKSLILQALELSMIKWVETVPLPDSPLPIL